MKKCTNETFSCRFFVFENAAFLPKFTRSFVHSKLDILVNIGIRPFLLYSEIFLLLFFFEEQTFKNITLFQKILVSLIPNKDFYFCYRKSKMRRCKTKIKM